MIPIIKVVNKYHRAQGEYIGRHGSPLGNPYLVKPHGPYSKEEAIDLYRIYFYEQIAADNPLIIKELDRLMHIALINGRLHLLCFCAPRPCHGDIIKEYLDKKIREVLEMQKNES